MRRHPMNLLRSLLLTLTTFGLAHVAAAAERVAPEASGPANVAPPGAKLPAIPENAEEIEAAKGQPQPGVIVTRRPAHKLTPMMAEILAYMDARDLLIQNKRQQYTASKKDPTAALAIQTEMQKLKFDTEIEVLRIQQRWAVKEGRAADAAAIEASIDDRVNPKVTLAPVHRPAPTAATGR